MVNWWSGWERAETEVTAFKQQRDAAIQQKLATEDRVEHLDGALKEVMKQLRCGREEHQERIHEIMVEKSQEYDHLRSEMESKLAEANHFLSLTRGELMECRAENKALSNALQVLPFRLSCMCTGTELSWSVCSMLE